MDINKNANLSMLCDFYELTMGNGYFVQGMQDRITYFDIFFRSVPDNGGYAIAAGLEQAIEYIQQLHFDEDDIAYLRSRPTNDGIPGVGAKADPYLDECAARQDLFEKLVRNERRIELCFEGQRFYDLRRWATDVSELNDVINRPRITRQSIAYEEVESAAIPRSTCRSPTRK